MVEMGITVLKEVKQLLKPIVGLNEKEEATKNASLINIVYDEYKSTGNLIRRRILDFPSKSAEIINLIQNG
jgi:hypothetical protein